MPHARSRLPVLLALGASALLHAFLFFALWRQEPAASGPPVARLIELEIRETVRPPAPVTEPLPPPASPSKRPKRPRATATAPARPEAPAASASLDAPTSSEPSAPGVGLPVRDAPTGLRLLPNASVLNLPSTPPQEVPGTGRVGTRLRAPEPQDVGESLRSVVSRQRVESGHVHGYYGQLQDVLLAAWQARETLARRKSGRTCEVEVRITQELSGALREVSILYPSCDPRMDEELLSDLRVAAHSLPAPPPEVIAHRSSLRSVFRFAFRPPPTLPPLEFDVVNLIDQKAIPRFNPRRVTLVAVE